MRKTGRCAAISLLILVLLPLAPTAAALEPMPREWEAVEQPLADGARHADLWHTGWGLFHGGGLAANLYLSSEADSPATRFDARVSAVKSALALGDLALNPLPHRVSRDRVQALRQEAADARSNLARAEAILARTAEIERQRRSWSSQLGGLVVNAAGGLIIALGDDRPGDGVVSFALGMAVNTAQTWSQPTQASRAGAARDESLAGRWRLSVSARHVAVAVAW